jgi:pyrophosphatase PpaX
MHTRTILFDLDGTLIDTNELITASFNYTFERFQMDFADEEIIEFNGPPLIETFKRIDPVRADEMVAVYRTYNLEVHDEYVKIFPNVQETLEALRAKNMKLGVVTTKMSPGAERGLEKTGIAEYFDTVVTLSQVSHPKPHPEPVIKAMKQLDALNTSTIMVGDNSHDIEAGKNAGVRTAGVSWSQKGKEHLKYYEPTYMLDDMTDLIRIAGE